ncbi:MAG: hypothetical protein C0404_13935 [Verrucomicrobia bacterium]|nr:hypothetical protein [Verrucomicrobiota bacterium]
MTTTGRYAASWAACAMLAMFVVAAQAGSADLSLNISVQEPAGVAQAAAPVSGGIPLPKGIYGKDQSFALFDGEKEVPSQVVPLVLDEEGKLRWVLLDFQTDLSAGQNRSFTLKAAKPAGNPSKPLKATDSAEAVTLDTGAISIVFSKTKPFSLFDSVSAGGKSVVAGGQVRYTDGFDDKVYVADKPESVVLEYSGPMRATVAIKGRFVGDDKNKFRYVARITAHAGHSDVHVKYSLCNSNPDHYCYRMVKDSTVELKLAAQSSAVTVGGSKDVDLGPEGWITCGLKASVAGAVKAGSGEEVKWTGTGGKETVGGWLLCKAGDAGICVTDLYFADDPARSLAAGKESLLLTGITERYDGVKDNKGKSQGEPYPSKARWIFDCSHLSSQYAIDFVPAGDPSVNARAARSLVHAVAPPDWYFDKTESLAVGKFGTQADEMAAYDAWGWKYDKKKAPASSGLWKPRWIQREDNHFDTEQDSLDALCLMYLRTGSRPFMETAHAWANYHMDLQTWRTDGWQYKDGGVWWMKSKSGPAGNRPQRAADPVTGVRNYITGMKVQKESTWWLTFLCDGKECYCHNWGEGLADWFCLTGDRDALESLVDAVEQNYDTQKRAFGKAPGKDCDFSRDFNRSSYMANAARMILPSDPLVVEMSDFLASVYLQRPVREPRGFVNGAKPFNLKWCNGDTKVVEDWFKGFIGDQGMAEMNKLGITIDVNNGQFADPKSGAKWFPIASPHTWMFPPLSRAMEAYYRATGNEDAHDWVIAYGQAVAHVLFQERHGTLDYGKFLVDAPVKGVAKDHASWVLPPEAKDGEGIRIDGYLAQFHPDVCARAYELCGEPLLKQRAYDFWNYGSHRPYGGMKLVNMGSVSTWANIYGEHSEHVCFTGKTFYHWAHPRKDDKPPKAVADLAVAIDGDKAKVTFTAPADEGGGTVARYQVKCSDRPIVSYEDFLKAWSANTDEKVMNWWMAANLTGEPKPGAAGSKENFEVKGMPAGAKHFAVCSFDDSQNRSRLFSFSIEK